MQYKMSESHPHDDKIKNRIMFEWKITNRMMKSKDDMQENLI